MSSREEQVANYLSRIAAKSGVENLLSLGLEGGQEAPSSPAAMAVRKAAETGLSGILKKNRVPTAEQAAGLEAIILPKIRPVLDVVDGKFQTDHPLWLKLNDENETSRRKLLAVISSIGRIELPGHPDYPYGGTGFVVGPGLVMTNRHVAAMFTSGVGTRRLSIKPGYKAGIDFLRELDRPTGPTLRVKRVVMVHPYWDMALLEVEGLSDQAKPLTLSQRDVAAGGMIEVAAIGYPAFDTRNDASVQNDLFRSVFGVKRLQPGTLGGLQETESFGKLVPAVRHNCSTLGGNSGSALIDLATGEVVALHFGGRYRVINYGVPAFELAKDGKVVDAGVKFSGEIKKGQPHWNSWWTLQEEAFASDLSQSVTKRHDTSRSDSPRRDTTRPGSASTGTHRDSDVGSLNQLRGQSMPDGSVQFVVPLHVTIRLGSAGLGVDVRTNSDLTDETIERMVMPWHDDSYNSRQGYNSMFLGVEIPLPEPTDPSVVALTKEGAPILHYQNFSIVTHAKRRMALFTASNVTAEPLLKRPEAGRVYTRKGLSGLGANDQERWFADPRLSDEYQLPDIFYTSDDGAFDKGHIVRREDVAWGDTYDVVRRANGDTYHVTNCSPQVAGFNRSALGADNWGDLEDHVLKGAASERYCQFSGPVLDPSDEVFLGSGGGRVRLRVKIPSRYWKVIVVRTEEGVASYGFVLEQNLADVTFEEFAVPEQFARFMEPLEDIQQRACIQFPEVILESDQHSTNEGLDLAFHAGVRRRSMEDGIISEGVIQ